MTPETILTTWFPDDPALAQRLWWAKDDATDADLRARFGDTLAAAGRGELDAWAETAQGRLALIVVLDQMSRNILRGRPEAFASDPIAQRLAHGGLERGHDAELPAAQRVFMYMPLMHSEKLADQVRCVELFRKLADASGSNSLMFAERHHEIVARFGRFPHRNAVLGRESTAEELAFLAGPNSSF